MRILNIQRMSTEDGPGLRTTVFFKGCPLSCTWCHNPESIVPTYQKEWIKVRCIGCHLCIEHCPKHALVSTPTGIITDPEKCDLCLQCVEQCPTGAMSRIGKPMTVSALFKEVIKDTAYFNGDGGVSLSGGEVLSQSKEVLELCIKLKEHGISVAIDTSGFAPYASIEGLLPFVDLFLYDLKLANSGLHKRYCGVDNELIKENLKKLSATAVKIWIRTPIIPNATDTNENISAIAVFLKENQIRYDRWELCAFNNLCRDKYVRLNRSWDFAKTLLPTKKQMLELVEIARTVTGEKEKITCTGVTRLEEETV